MKELFEGKVFAFDHPLIQHKITHLCDVNTTKKEFKEIVNEITMLMGYEALNDLKLTKTHIVAPLSEFDSPVIEDKLAIVPILRAGLGMVEGLCSLYPNAKVGHVGLYRDEKTLLPVEYYCKLPVDCINGQCLIVDPALATGGSAVAAISAVKQRGFKNIKFLCLFGAKQGIENILKNHSDVKIYVAHYTEDPLDEHGYIVTAAGDAGDRIFGTK